MTRRLKPCGTEGAYRRHIKHREVPCEACRAAANEYSTNRRRARGVPARPLAPCGTTGAYQRYTRAGEKPCEACADAWRTYQQAAKKARRAS